ncbi:unannotated protein [freshwater metagenome]
MGTLAFERGALTLGQQLGFMNEWSDLLEQARLRGLNRDPIMRQRIAAMWIDLQVMRYTAMRSLSSLESGTITRETSISKLYWATLHRDLGNLALDVLGPDGEIADGENYDLSLTQRIFLYTRADTIYGGSNEIQRNVIGERVLGLPPEPKVV